MVQFRRAPQVQQIILAVVAAFAATLLSASLHAESSEPQATSHERVQRKIVLADDAPRGAEAFAVARDGRRIYLAAGNSYHVFDASGKTVQRIPLRGHAADLALLNTGEIVSAQDHARGNVSLLHRDGSLARELIVRGRTRSTLRNDVTGWTTPTGVAVDERKGWTFVVDSTRARRGQPDPEWSRVAVFDRSGRFLKDIVAYDSATMAATDERRTWYDDIEVDPNAERVYVTPRARKELLAFDYSGKLHRRAPGVGGLAVLPNGRVAVGEPGGRAILVYDPALSRPKRLVAAPTVDLEADGAGRLYAIGTDPTVLFTRWSSDLRAATEVKNDCDLIEVRFGARAEAPGDVLQWPATAIARKQSPPTAWRVFARKLSEAASHYAELPASWRSGSLTVSTPESFEGPYEVLVTYGRDRTPRRDRDALAVSDVIWFVPKTELAAIAVESVSGRSAFVQGEPIVFSVRSRTIEAGTVRVMLRRESATLGSSQIALAAGATWEVPSEVTRRLPPGRYALAVEGHERAYPLEFDVSQSEPDSPVQRILYHEFEQAPATLPQTGEASVVERMRYIRDHVRGVANLGFTRETDRAAARLADDGGVWGLEPPVPAQSLPPSPHYRIPSGGAWEAELYLDRATAFGLRYDTQLLPHCAAVRAADTEFPKLNAQLQRIAQRLGRYPSFYGFNYNDELFFEPRSASGPVDEDTLWIERFLSTTPGSRQPDAFRVALSRMYAQFNLAVHAVNPALARTATPMWQHPAVEGSYAPTIYAGMTESYSHYLSEGYTWPWYAPHSVDILKRPGLKTMGVVDNGHGSDNGDVYLKNALLVLGRGVQGVGLQHAKPFKDAAASSAMRLMNELAKAYGPVFADAQPLNEGAILYSYSQDITERRKLFGTPHWEKVFVLHSAGLMAGFPLEIVYEEDLASGALLVGGRPRVPTLFLVGQREELPVDTRAGVRAFQAAGGRVFVVGVSRDFPGGERLALPELDAIDVAKDAYDSDALFPATIARYAAISDALKAALAARRRLAVDVDAASVAVNRLDGGAVTYVLLATETGAYPWEPPVPWSLGTRYNRSYQSQRVTLRAPNAPVIYDVFDRRVLAPGATQGRVHFEADLRYFPGRLYALASRRLGAPRVSVEVSARTMRLRAAAGIPAVVPLRIRISDRERVLAEFFRGTSRDGNLLIEQPRFISKTPLQVEVAELLGGATSIVKVPAAPLRGPLVRARPPVEVERGERIPELIPADAPLRVLVADAELAKLPAVEQLHAALVARGHSVGLGLQSTPPQSGTCIALGVALDARYGELISQARRQGLLLRSFESDTPAAARALISVVHAPRQFNEDCVIVLGGDERSLGAGVEALLELSAQPVGAQEAANGSDKVEASYTGTPGSGEAQDLPSLSARTGPQLTDIRARNGTIVVSARGALGNFAAVADGGANARIVAVHRFGESPLTTSLFLSLDGGHYGLAARTTRRFGEAVYLASANDKALQAFSSFGDAEGSSHEFGVSADAQVIVSPGPYGVVAWRRFGTDWREAWSEPYHQRFSSLPWPISSSDERIPSFDVVVPARAQVALVAFGERRNNGWVSEPATSLASVTARDLRTGRARWTYEAPVRGKLILPKLYSNDTGALVLLQLHLPADREYQFFQLQDGREVARWRSQNPAAAVSIGKRALGITYASVRRVDVRDDSGALLASTVRSAQPVSLALADDEQALLIADDEPTLERRELSGLTVWQRRLPSTAKIAVDGASVYTAGWDGRVRAFKLDGVERWSVDLSSRLGERSATASDVPDTIYVPRRASTASAAVPKTPNLLRTRRAKVTVGGTAGWKSRGAVQVTADMLTNGRVDDVERPWLSLSEQFWAATAGRQVWAQIDFQQPTDVSALTVYENPRFPDSFPTAAVIQVWDEARQQWRTAQHALFLEGPVNTHALGLKGVKRLRYVPWASYLRNFYTSEIEVR